MTERTRLPAALRAVLPAATREAWERIVPVVPDVAYLVGGTAVAIHLGHRRSRDLDFFTTAPFDPAALVVALQSVGEFAATTITEGSLTGMLEGAKVQFFDAHQQDVLAPPTLVAGIRVAGLRDLLATKLKVIGDRGTLRDYFDLMVIEGQTELRVEQGLAFYLARYKPQTPESSLAHIVRALGSFGDVDDDLDLPVARSRVERYWRRRQAEVATALDALRADPAAQPHPSGPTAA